MTNEQLAALIQAGERTGAAAHSVGAHQAVFVQAGRQGIQRL